MTRIVAGDNEEDGMARSTVLVVEDDPDILNLVSYNLRTAGFQVRSTQTVTMPSALQNSTSRTSLSWIS